jgi:hypothetical protein
MPIITQTETSELPASDFEMAVEAIISGDTAALETLLRRDPNLVRSRSSRKHRSTLLHYVSANGVEDFRQKTPQNIVEIAKLLLRAGADVNAESEAYGGGSTTLALTATSVHPEKAGVQLELLQLLIDHGARIDGPDGRSTVNASLHNGRGMAAEFLASCGARLDLEGAAGVGRLDIVSGFFHSDGSLKGGASAEQMNDAFAWACEFGRTEVVRFLLDKGVKVEAKLKPHGGTGLHWAVYGGHIEIVELLLRFGSAVNSTDETYNGTPLDWALHAWGHTEEGPERERYYEVVRRLVRAGAKLRAGESTVDVRSDARMMAAFNGYTFTD